MDEKLAKMVSKTFIIKIKQKNITLFVDWTGRNRRTLFDRLTFDENALPVKMRQFGLHTREKLCSDLIKLLMGKRVAIIWFLYR